MYSAIFEEALSMQDELTTWQHTLHQMPELGLELPQTVAFVQKTLQDLDIPFQTIANGSGILVQFGQGERCLLLRADMDALPIPEESGESYAATNGNMHACGHDMNCTCLLGAAKLLKAHESALKCTVKLLFQPGEETFNGARACLDSGIMQNPTVHAAVAGHVASFVPLHDIAYGKHTFASVYGFKITIHGKGTHGAMPDQGIDPINVGVHIYQGLQALIARECAPSTEISLTIGQFAAGTANNVIPDTCILQGSLRSYDEEARKRMIARITEVTEHCAAAFGTTADIEILSDVPMVSCDDALNQRMADAIATMSDTIHIYDGLHVTASEDFSLISELVPAVYLMIGAQTDDAVIYNHHNAKVRFSDDALPIGAAAFAVCALEWQ